MNHESERITLIRGHQYPPPDFPANGFDYAIEEQFHDYEYDTECLDWDFVKIPNVENIVPYAITIKQVANKIDAQI